MKKKTELTLAEKAVLVYHCETGFADFDALYAVTDPKVLRLAPATQHNKAVKWRKDDLVQRFLLDYKEVMDNRKRELVSDYLKQSGRDDVPLPMPTKRYKDFVDYTDPRAQMRKLNELVNEAEDSKETLDALKTIMGTQREDREAAKAQEVQRFYTPMVCHECPLYELGEKRLKAMVKNESKG